jgi:hypothetical protein
MASLRAWVDHPAFRSVRPALLALPPEGFPSLAQINAALGPRAGVVFEPQPVKPRRSRRPTPLAERYYGRITHQGRVPTREDNWHDLANALVWACFPVSKRALAGRQQACLERAGVAPGGQLPCRDREQDALSLLDEGGLLLVGPREGELRAALSEGEGAVLALLDAGRAEAWVYGHALLEHVASGRDAQVQASVTPLEAPEGEGVDQALAARLRDRSAFLRPHPWAPLRLN